MTLKFDGSTQNTIGHLFHTTSSFVHHFKTIGEFKLELQSGNAQFGSKSAIFLSCVTLKFDGWHKKTIGHIFYIMSNLVHHFRGMGEFKLELQSGNAQFRSKSLIFFCPMWLWNYTDELEKQQSICYFKLCPSFQSHWWIQTLVRVRKHSIRVKISNFLSRVTLKFDGQPLKTIGHILYSAWSFVQHFIAIGEFKLELRSGNAQFVSKSTFF